LFICFLSLFTTEAQRTQPGAPQPKKIPPFMAFPLQREGEGGGDFRGGLGKWFEIWSFFGSRFPALQENFLPHKNDPLSLQNILRRADQE
jgi:hypothetical protein